MNWKVKLKTPLISNFLSMVTMQGINYLLPLITTPYLLRVMGAERLGLVSSAYVFINYFVLFTDFGFNLSGTKYISENKADQNKVNRFLNSAMFGRLILCLLSFVAYLFIIQSFEVFRIEKTFYMLYFGIVIGNIMTPRWFFQGMERMKYIAIFTFITKSLSMLPLFFIVKGADDYFYVPIFYSIGYLCSGVASLYFIYRDFKMKFCFTSLREILFSLKDSSTYFISRASTSIYATSNTFILKLVCGNEMAGYYTAAERIYQAYNQLIIPFSDVLFPHMVNRRDVPFFKKIFFRIIVANIFLLGGIFLCSDLIIDLIYAPENEYILQLFRILLIASFFSIPSMLIGYPFVAAMGHPQYTNWTSMVTSAFHILCLLILYMFNGISIYTACIVIVCSELLLFSLRAGGIWKYGLFKK